MEYFKKLVGERIYLSPKSGSDEEIRKFTNKVFNTLREFNISLNITPITSVGGGAAVMKHYGEIESKNISYIEDIKANAKGFEYLAKAFMISKSRQRGGI